MNRITTYDVHMRLLMAYFCIGEMTYSEEEIGNRTLSGEGEPRHRLRVRSYRRGYQPGQASRGVRILHVTFPPHPEGCPR